MGGQHIAEVVGDSNSWGSVSWFIYIYIYMYMK